MKKYLTLLLVCLALTSYAQINKLNWGGNKEKTEATTENTASDSTQAPKQKAIGGSNLMGKLLVGVAKVAGNLGV